MSKAGDQGSRTGDHVRARRSVGVRLRLFELRAGGGQRQSVSQVHLGEGARAGKWTSSSRGIRTIQPPISATALGLEAQARWGRTSDWEGRGLGRAGGGLWVDQCDALAAQETHARRLGWLTWLIRSRPLEGYSG
jgi:hypothetical protein